MNESEEGVGDVCLKNQTMSVERISPFNAHTVHSTSNSKFNSYPTLGQKVFYGEESLISHLYVSICVYLYE